ncbi:hypothetical protein [Hydrogenophaga sp. A37]|nr:hypothetical protein [Hydrogenophaga sp. A37]
MSLMRKTASLARSTFQPDPLQRPTPRGYPINATALICAHTG